MFPWKIAGCHRLADYLAGIKTNFEGAAKVLKENCENNLHSESCYKLGNYYLTGKGDNIFPFLFLSLSLNEKTIQIKLLRKYVVCYQAFMSIHPVVFCKLWLMAYNVVWTNQL